MNKICWLSRLSNQRFSRRVGERIALGIGVAALLMTTGTAIAQAPAPEAQPVTAPAGYSVHESIDLGGRISDQSGSGAMYDTLVNEESGPRVLGERFEMRALPGAKNTLFDTLTAAGSGYGGDPYSFGKLDFYKGRLYEFSGMFRRDRQYFDYDLLGNPNIPSGQSLPIGPSTAPTGAYSWPQVNQSPFLYNTVRRMTDTHLALLPLSKVTFRVNYSHDTFEGPSLSPSGYQLAGSYDMLLEEYQRNGTDDFLGGIDWKPVKDTKLTYEEVVDHYKADSHFTLDPSYYRFQEPDGTKVALLANYDSFTPSIACNANSVGTTPNISASQRGGLPVINPACAVVSSYLRTQPTRFLYPTEIFRFQSSSIRNVVMNGDVRYTNASMNLPLYYDNFQGLTKASATVGAIRSQTYTATAHARREVMAADYGITWQATHTFDVSDQLTFSNAQEPGRALTTSATEQTTPLTAGNESVNYAGPLTTSNAAPFEGTGAVGVIVPNFFGQRFVTNDVTGTWDGWSRATLSLTYRHQNHVIGEGIPHSAPLAPGATNDGTVTIDQDGGIFNAFLRPSANWDVNGSAEILYADNVFTPVAPRQLQHYRVHTLYRAKSWATISGAYNDMELHNNTNNTGTPSAAGPLDHVAHTRIAGLGAELSPNEHYGLSLNYTYSDVYTATNICYDGGASAALPVAAASSTGTGCPGATVRGATYLEFGPVKDFMDAPTQSGSVAVHLSPNTKLASNIGYRINSVNGSRFYNDPRDVAGSLVSTYESPFVNLAWTVRPGFIWKAEYNFYGYGEGGPSGAPYCTTATTLPTATTPAPVVSCASAGYQTGMTISPAGETAPRNFHANNVTLGFHYEF